jgi:hypothetical protein
MGLEPGSQEQSGVASEPQSPAGIAPDGGRLRIPNRQPIFSSPACQVLHAHVLHGSAFAVVSNAPNTIPTACSNSVRTALALRNLRG